MRERLAFFSVFQMNALTQIDIRLPEPELEAILKTRLNEYGTVKFVRLMPVAKNERYRFAFVQMSTMAENMDLAVAIGASTLSSGSVALRLETDEKANGAGQHWF